LADTFRAGYLQFDPVFGDVEGNLKTVLQALRQAEADLLVLPELPFTGYSFRDREELGSYAEDPRDSAVTEALVSVCGEKDIHLVAGFAERAGEKLYNSSLLLGPDGIISVYRKIHLFMNEPEYFDPGNAAPEVIDVSGVRVGMMICFDWAYPEVMRVLALKGADLVCHPSDLVLPYCQQAMLVRCMENSVYSITANRYGTEDRGDISVTFSGGSIIVGPRGEELHRGPKDLDELHVETIDPALARDKWMTHGNNLLADRRPDLYGELCQPGT
jgi:predicted amidohydrolase